MFTTQENNVFGIGVIFNVLIDFDFSAYLSLTSRGIARIAQAI